MADEGFLGGAKDKAEGIMGKGREFQEKLKTVAEEYGLDPNHLEDWPEEVKAKLHM